MTTKNSGLLKTVRLPVKVAWGNHLVSIPYRQEFQPLHSCESLGLLPRGTYLNLFVFGYLKLQFAHLFACKWAEKTQKVHGPTYKEHNEKKTVLSDSLQKKCFRFGFEKKNARKFITPF